MGLYILPTFKGYTVDLRLKEFRRALPGTPLEFIPFNTPEGKQLFLELEMFAAKILYFNDYE